LSRKSSASACFALSASSFFTRASRSPLAAPPLVSSFESFWQATRLAAASNTQDRVFIAGILPRQTGRSKPAFQPRAVKTRIGLFYDKTMRWSVVHTKKKNASLARADDAASDNADLVARGQELAKQGAWSQAITAFKQAVVFFLWVLF